MDQLMSCTVVMPTLGLALHITDDLLRELSLVSASTTRIILINNSNQSIQNRYSKFHKVEVVEDMPNLMVNPAWNFGMSMVRTEYYLLLNDDILLNGNLIDEALHLLSSRPDLNLTTVHTIVDYDYQRMRDGLRQQTKSNLEFDIRKFPDEIKQGWFMMARKSSWRRVKSKCLIMAGDDEIYQNNQIDYAGACYIKNRTIYHSESSSVKKVHLKPMPQVAKPLDLQSISDWV